VLVSLVIARVIAESGAPMPALSDDSVLMIKRTNIVVGDGCNEDPGGRDAGVDDSPPFIGPDDAGPSDAGVPDAPGDGGSPDAGCTSIPGDAITLVVQPRFMTNPQGMRFALLFVTPARPIVETKSSYLFGDLANVTAPKVEVHTRRVEDPYLGKQCGSTAGCGAPAEQESSGCETTGTWDPPSFGDGGLGDGGLIVETIGPYEVLRAEPADTNELATWLTGLNYRYDQADLDAVAPYIALDYTVVAVRVAVDEQTTTTAFTPIALTWPGSELRLPAAFGTASVTGATTVYIAGDGRFDLPGAFVPFAYRTSFGDAGFLTKNEIVLDSATPAEDPVAYHVAGDPSEREVIFKEETVRVPVDKCFDDIGCCGNCSTGRHRVRPDMIVVVLACGFVLRRKRRRRE
jgi:hypothetical protein